MDLKQIESFVRVAELGSFTRAAGALGMPQPLLSRHVRQLEVELRQTFLLRNGRGVTLTEAGLVLLDTSARPDTAEAAAARVALMKLAETDLEAVFEQLMPRLSHPLRMNLPAVRGVVHSMMSSLGKDVFIRQQGAIMTRPDSRPDNRPDHRPDSRPEVRPDNRHDIRPGARHEVRGEAPAAMPPVAARPAAPLAPADRPRFLAMLKTLVEANNDLSRAPSEA